VASNSREITRVDPQFSKSVLLGILRFKTNQSVDRAMKTFRTGEIVVQDVAVQVKLLRPGSTTGPLGEEVQPATKGGSSAIS